MTKTKISLQYVNELFLSVMTTENIKIYSRAHLSLSAEIKSYRKEVVVGNKLYTF